MKYRRNVNFRCCCRSAIQEPLPTKIGEARPTLTGRCRPVIDRADALCRGQHLVRIEHEFLGGSFIEIDVTFRCFVEGYDRHVHGFRDLNFIMEDRLHQLTIVLEDRGLTRLQGVAFCPAQT